MTHVSGTAGRGWRAEHDAQETAGLIPTRPHHGTGVESSGKLASEKIRGAIPTSQGELQGKETKKK